MTHNLYDPKNFSKTSVSQRPEMLHFQYGGSDDVFRYVLVERIPWAEINTATRRKVGEGTDESIVKSKYVKGEKENDNNDSF